jgi:hypothetical protein
MRLRLFILLRAFMIKQIVKLLGKIANKMQCLYWSRHTHCIHFYPTV